MYVTVFYDPTNTFQTALAALLQDAQLVPHPADPALPVYVTPEVVLFEGTTEGATDDSAFTERGFETVRRLHGLHPKDYFSNLAIYSGLNATVVFNTLMHYKFGLQSEYPVQTTLGKSLCFVAGLETRDIAATIKQIATRPTGLETYEELCVTGKAIFEERERLANYHIDRAQKVETESGTFAFCWNGPQKSMAELIPVRPDCKELDAFILLAQPNVEYTIIPLKKPLLQFEADCDWKSALSDILNFK